MDNDYEGLEEELSEVFENDESHFEPVKENENLPELNSRRAVRKFYCTRTARAVYNAPTYHSDKLLEQVGFPNFGFHLREQIHLHSIFKKEVFV